MVKKEKVRDSNFELMRIISMFMIILTHIITRGKIVHHAVGKYALFFQLCKCILFVHVNSFILLTGYYQYNKKFKLSKIFQINNATWFYSVVLTFLIVLFGWWPVTKVEMIKTMLPLPLSGYWFIRMYLYLYCLTPLLNILIEKVDQKYHRRIIYVGILLFSVLPTITHNYLFDNFHGFSLPSFVLLYFIGAYFRKYPIDKSRIFEVFSKQKQVITILSVYVISILFNFLLSNFALSLSGGEIVTEIKNTIYSAVFSYDNPILIVTSVCYFLLFYYLRFYSKKINSIGKLVFGVYLIHDHYILNHFLYRYFGFSDMNGNGFQLSFTWKIIIWVWIVGIIIYVVCLVIEWIRQKIFKFIYDWKVSSNIRNKFYRFIKSF